MKVTCRKGFIFCIQSCVMIEDLEETRHMIFAKHVYTLSYNKDTKEYACDCIGFQVHRKCKHVKEFRRYLEDLMEKRDSYNKGTNL